MAQLDRVVIINDDCVESGGAAAIALTAARQLRRNGVPVTFVTGDRGVNSQLIDLDVEIVALGGRHLLEGRRSTAAFQGLYSAKTRNLFGAWIEKHDTPGTIYHLHNWHKILSPSVFVPLRGVTARLFLSTHDFFLACPNGGYFHFPSRQPCNRVPMSMGCVLTSCDKRHYAHKLWRVARQTVRNAIFDLRTTEATVLAVHEEMIPILERGGIERRCIRVLRNPVTPWRTSRVEAERNCNAFFVGRLEYDKGVDLLAKAAAQTGAPLQVIGSGPMNDALQRAHPNIQLLGQRTRSEISELIAQARFLVVPSLVRETFGLVALEALTSGVPVIISNFALIANEITASGFGLSCRPDNNDDLAEAIRNLMVDNKRVSGMSRRAFKYAHTLAHTPETWCSELLRNYEQKLLMASGLRSDARDAVPSGANQTRAAYSKG